ncbi:hypothetical protein HK100_011333 [Physocladia obscura]|uniref:PH domain-containing protein n=1 Tax=Physocladia obscura TaxID=109957 RepID=A0AAD5XM59_9FUNG|nr:hypothetical protein HK100_011333 [Physocladia obscura]
MDSPQPIDNTQNNSVDANRESAVVAANSATEKPATPTSSHTSDSHGSDYNNNSKNNSHHNNKLSLLMASLADFGLDNGIEMDQISDSTSNLYPTSTVPVVRGRGAFVSSSQQPQSPVSSRSASSARTRYDGLPDHIMQRMTTVAFLQKLTSEFTSEQRWKTRYFVLGNVDANLYLFKASAASNPKSLPITFLPITACNDGFFDPVERGWILQVYGDGMNPDGSGDTVERIWTLKFPDENALTMWIQNINAIISAKQIQQIYEQQQQQYQQQQQQRIHIPKHGRDREFSFSRTSLTMTGTTASDSLRSPSLELSYSMPSSPPPPLHIIQTTNQDLSNLFTQQQKQQQQPHYSDYSIAQKIAVEKFRIHQAEKADEHERQKQQTREIEFANMDRQVQQRQAAKEAAARKDAQEKAAKMKETLNFTSLKNEKQEGKRGASINMEMEDAADVEAQQQQQQQQQLTQIQYKASRSLLKDDLQMTRAHMLGSDADLRLGALLESHNTM